MRCYPAWPLAALPCRGCALKDHHLSTFISDIAEITDPEGFKAVGQRPQSEATDRVTKAGGRYVTRTQKLTAVYGIPPQRLIIIEFDNMEKAQAFATGETQKQIDAITDKSAKIRRFYAEGL